MADTSIGHGQRQTIALGMLEHVPLDGFPEIQDLPAAEGANLINAYQQDGVLHALPDGAGVVFDADGEFVSCEISISHVAGRQWFVYVSNGAFTHHLKQAYVTIG